MNRVAHFATVNSCFLHYYVKGQLILRKWLQHSRVWWWWWWCYPTPSEG